MPFAVTQEMDKKGSTPTMFYITKTDSEASFAETTGYTAQRKKTEEGLWLSFDAVREILPRSSHKKIVNRVIEVSEKYAATKGKTCTVDDVCPGCISRAHNPVPYEMTMAMEKAWQCQFVETTLLS